MSSAIRNYTLLLVGCVAFHVLGTWSLPLIDRDEPRFAEASREMIEYNDYIVPHFNNQFRFDKPPLAYWAQVASYKIFGENDFAARFPSALAAALIALSIAAWGARLGDHRAGWWAAILFTLSLQVFAHGKAAVADMWLVLFMTLAHWAGCELIDHRKTPNVQWRWWVMFYLSLAFGFLAKGPIAFLPLLTVAAVKWQDRQIQLGKSFAFVRGSVLAFAVISLWAVPALMQTHGEFFRVGIGRHVIARSIGTMEGHGAASLLTYFLLLPFYFITIFISCFPWSIKLPWLSRRVWRERDKIDIYLVAGIASVFVIFTLVRTKLPHYILPAFPLISLLLARHLVSAQFPARRFRIASVATAVLLGLVALIVPPLVAPQFPARQLFQEAWNDLRPEMEFGAVDFAEPSLVWYFRARVHGWMTTLDRAGAKPFMAKPGPRFVILPADVAESLFAERPSEWKTFTAHGYNVAKGKQVDLTLVLKP